MNPTFMPVLLNAAAARRPFREGYLTMGASAHRRTGGGRSRIMAATAGAALDDDGARPPTAPREDREP
jgi:hypothetical protein